MESGIDCRRDVIGVKVFSATKARDRETMGEAISEWIYSNPGITITEKIVKQSSDSEFHCLSIILFFTYTDK